jgi:hypothetical protein
VQAQQAGWPMAQDIQLTIPVAQPQKLEIYQAQAMDEQLMIQQSELIVQQDWPGGLQPQTLAQQPLPGGCNIPGCQFGNNN